MWKLWSLWNTVCPSRSRGRATYLRASIHLLRVRREVLMLPLSLRRSCVLKVLAARSAPAKSHRDSLKQHTFRASDEFYFLLQCLNGAWISNMDHCTGWYLLFWLFLPHLIMHHVNLKSNKAPASIWSLFTTKVMVKWSQAGITWLTH